MEPVRVLNFVGRMDRGGIENLIMNIYRNIDRERVQFDFMCHYGVEAEYNEEIRSMGGRIYEMPRLKSGSRVYYHKAPVYVAALYNFFKEHKEHPIIHGHMTNTAAIYMPMAKKYGGVKCCIAHSHSVGCGGLFGSVTNMLQKPLAKIADEYFACSKAAARWMFSEKDIDSGRVKIIHNGIIPEKFSYNHGKAAQIRRELGIENRFVIGNAGNFRAEKNQDFLIDVLAEVKKIRGDSVLVLVGDGEKTDGVRAKADASGLSRSVIFLGSREDTERIMQAFDVYVLPSFFEGFPMAAVEAQAAGLPLVISDTVTREINITGNCEFISLGAGPRLWAEKIIEISSGFERTDASELIKNGGCDIRPTAKWLEEFYLSRQGGL
ncbi:MAG: glycosyltransferase family 1 protein [Clostridia bacterium]